MTNRDMAVDIVETVLAKLVAVDDPRLWYALEKMSPAAYNRLKSELESLVAWCLTNKDDKWKEV